MLTPRKHLDLDVSVIRVAAVITRELRKRGVIQFEQMRSIVVKRVGANGDLSFLPSINFLFLLGRLEYHIQNDTLEHRVD